GGRAVRGPGRALRGPAGATGALSTVLQPVPRVLVLGAGLDAVPVVALAASLGWFVVVGDHRPAYLERGGFARADRVVHIDPAKLPEHVALGYFDAYVVLSLYLETERTNPAHLSVVPLCHITDTVLTVSTIPLST